ncbi:hypothetical protein [Streptomyces sp. NPDC048521]|uniref:hypothetical protein n=1 Tax=Streptomyces sp. NPDC048521 TaxID=3365566 RepID=UPI0037137140
MRKMIPTAVLAVVTGMMLCVSPAQAETPANGGAARTTGADTSPLGDVARMGPVSLPETLVRLLPFD